MNKSAASIRPSSWRSESQPPIIISAAAFPSLAKVATGQSHLPVKSGMNYKASLEKVVPKATPILLVQTSQKGQKGRIYERKSHDYEDTIVHAEEEEYNAEIMSDRRRGDKGFW